MATTTNLTTLKINYLTQEQYDNALANGQINSDELYLTPANNVDTTGDGVLFVTGTGTAAVTSSPYTYAKWDATVSEITSLHDGLTILYKVPVAGNGTYGTCLQINALGYHPVVRAVDSMISTRYGVGAIVLLTYNSAVSGTVYSSSTSSSTISGCWVCVNDQDNNSNTLLRTYASTTAIELPLVGASTATTPSTSTYTTGYKDSYGQIPSTVTLRPTVNLSTGALKVPGGITANVTGNLSGTASVASKIGTSTVGSASNPIYLSSGTPTTVSIPKSGAWFQGVPAIGSDGVMEVGKYIDFHATTATTADYNARITANTNGLEVSATATTTLGRLRNISYGTGTPSGGSSGDVYIQYTA